MAQAAGYSFNPATVDGTTVRDLAGYFLHGTLVGSAAIVAGKYGNGLNCTGGGLSVPVACLKSGDSWYPLNADGGLTVAAQVKLNTTTAAKRCIASLTSGGTLRWALYASNASGNVEMMIAGVTYATTTSIRDGAFHHVMAVLDATGTDVLKIVVDGTVVLTVNTTAALATFTTATMVAGRNAQTSSEALDGIIDDLRWFNDPVETGSWAGLTTAEQIDHQLAIYTLDADSGADSSIYSRGLTMRPSASFTNGIYGRAMTSTSTEAGAAGVVDFPDCDRLAISGWMRLDTAPVGSPAPIMVIKTSGGADRLRVVVNTNRTVTATWTTIDDGVQSVTSTTALTVGQWTRYQISMNPTYVGIRIGTATQQITNMGDGIPHLAPAVNGLHTLYLGGDDTVGGQITYNYAVFTKNFIAELSDSYWVGSPVVTPYRPANIARGVYHFNEGAGTTVDDKSPSNHDLTFTAAGSWVAGIQGTALGSNGTGGGATAALVWPATPLGFAVSAWVKARTSSSGARWLVLRNSTGEVAHVGRLNGRMWLRLYGPSGDTGIFNPTAAAFPAETWTHLAASCDQQVFTLYLNGKPVARENYGAGALRQPNLMSVGGDTVEGSVADIDDLRVFDTPISAANIAWMYANLGQYYDAAPAPFQGWGIPL